MRPQKLSRHLLLWLALCVAQPANAEPGIPGGDFSLTSHRGEIWSLQNARGKLVLLQFGYTSCPHICPTSLLTVQQVMQKLGEQAAGVQPVFISVDPKRDTPDVLNSYVGNFHPAQIGLTGQPTALADISHRYRSPYNDSDDTDSPDYIVNHSTSLYVINARGRLANIIPFGAPTDIILDSVRRLLTQ